MGVWQNNFLSRYLFVKMFRLYKKLPLLSNTSFRLAFAIDFFIDRRDQLKGMSDRIQRSRKLLYEKLKALGTPGDWQHIITQNGMFTFTGLNRKFLIVSVCLIFSSTSNHSVIFHKI